MQKRSHGYSLFVGHIIVFILLYAGSSNANLILNSGFETGDFQSWTNGGFSFVEPCPIDYLGVPGGVPCAVDGGNYHTAIGLFFNTVDNGSIEQEIILPGPGIYEFGATVSFGYVSASGDLIEGNFDTGSVSLSIPSIAQSSTVEFVPNENLSLFSELPSTAPGIRLQTDWFEMSGMLQYDGTEAVTAVLYFDLQDAASPDNIFLTHFLIDNAFVKVVPVPAPAWLFSSGLIGLIGIARRRKS